MADNFLGRFITIFITVIVGVVLLVSIANIVWETTNTFDSDNDEQSIEGLKTDTGNMTEGGQITLDNNFIITITSSTLDNGTNNATLTDGTDYTIVKSTGVVTFSDTAVFEDNLEGGNVTDWTYTHGDNFVQDSVSRTLLNLIIIFFALGILFVALMFKDELQGIFS